MADDLSLASLNIVSNTNQQQAIENASNFEDFYSTRSIAVERRSEILFRRPYFVVNADGCTLSLYRKVKYLYI